MAVTRTGHTSTVPGSQLGDGTDAASRPEMSEAPNWVAGCSAWKIGTVSGIEDRQAGQERHPHEETRIAGRNSAIGTAAGTGP